MAKHEQQAIQVISHLETLKGKPGGLAESQFEQNCNSLSNWLLFAAGVLFVLLFCTGFALRTNGVMSDISKLIVQILAISCIFTAISATILQIISGLASMLLYQRNAPKLRAVQFSHDLVNAKSIADTSLEVLDLADEWLNQKIKRIERRLSFFFGGADKLALFALVSAGWAMGKEMISGATLTGLPDLILFGLAALVGMAIGGIALRKVADRLSYNREIVALAKKIAISQTENRLSNV